MREGDSTNFKQNAYECTMYHIGIGTRGGGRGARDPPSPPIFYPQDLINIHTCSTDHCILHLGPPKMKLLSRPMQQGYEGGRFNKL